MYNRENYNKDSEMLLQTDGDCNQGEFNYKLSLLFKKYFDPTDEMFIKKLKEFITETTNSLGHSMQGMYIGESYHGGRTKEYHSISCGWYKKAQKILGELNENK